MTTKNQEQLKKVTGMNEIPFISAGIAADTDGFVVTEDGLTALVEASVENETAQARITELTNQLTTAQAAQQTAEAALATANTNLATANTSLTTLQARVTELEGEDAGAGSATGKKEDEFAKTEIDALEMPFEKEIRGRI